MLIVASIALISAGFGLTSSSGLLSNFEYLDGPVGDAAIEFINSISRDRNGDVEGRGLVIETHQGRNLNF